MKERGEENVIFYCSVGVEKERKENGVDKIFHGLPFVCWGLRPKIKFIGMS